MSAVIKNIEPGSPAYGTKLSVGDRLLKINGYDVIDVLDYKFYSYDSKIIIETENSEGKRKRLKIKKHEGEDLGLEFETYLMDKARSCANNCMFCFVDQLPDGMRSSLYFKDDDARLSFLQGSYITLTNLSKREIDRIISMHISPINVSVHTTNPELRNKMLGSKNGAAGLNTIRRFADVGITMNCQVVCCPGVNDGAELTRTMAELAELYPSVNSVSIVPVGLTKHREGLCQLRPFDSEHAVETIAQVEEFADKCLAEKDSRIFFCSDELYIKAGRELPEDEFYEGYPQLENGVGMMRLLIEEFNAELDTLDNISQLETEDFSIATGVSAAKFLEELLCTVRQKCDKIKGNVFPIKNVFFGETIDVAGLITGGDLITQLRGKSLGKRLLIPVNMLRHGEGVFLDDVTVSQVEQELGVPVVIVEQDGAELVRAFFGLNTN